MQRTTQTNTCNRKSDYFMQTQIGTQPKHVKNVYRSTNIIYERKILKPEDGEFVKPMPNKSCRKSLEVEEGTDVSSALRSSKSTKGAAGGFATPFGNLSVVAVEDGWLDLSATMFACEELVLFPI